MRKMHVRKKIKFKSRNILMFLFILITLGIYIFISFVNSKISPVLMNYASLETKKLANLIINSAVNKQVSGETNIDDLFIIIQNETGEIQTIDFNPLTVNKILSNTVNLIHTNLKAIQSGNVDLINLTNIELTDYDKEKLKKGIFYEVPMGVITKNALLSNLGPKIPVRLNLAGDVVSNLNTKITDYGINNALMEVNVIIEVSVQVILPFASERVNISAEMPLAIKMIQGKIPEFYAGSLNSNSPTFSLPIGD